MPFLVQLSEDNTYVLVTVIGQVDTRVAMEFSSEAHRVARENRIQRMLIDMTDSRNVQSESENYDLINKDFDGNQAIDRRVKVALCVAPEDHSHDFTETVARSDGFNVRLFRCREDALAFLKS